MNKHQKGLKMSFYCFSQNTCQFRPGALKNSARCSPQPQDTSASVNSLPRSAHLRFAFPQNEYIFISLNFTQLVLSARKRKLDDNKRVILFF